MNKIPFHRRFLDNNNLSPADLPAPHRRMLKNYDLLESMLHQALDEERESIEERLKRLDYELTEAFYTEYFDENDENPLSESAPEVHKRQLSRDELILMRLWDQGVRSKIPRSLFIQEGINVPISGVNIPIGSFILRKTGVFRQEYNLERLSEI